MRAQWVSIDTVLTWSSVDYCYIKNKLPEDIKAQVKNKTMSEVQAVLSLCNQDPQYQDVLESINTYGLRKCLCRDGDMCQADGHHRLLAAIELGYKWLPYLYSDEPAGDSWSFRLSHSRSKIAALKKIYKHPENPLPLCLQSH